MVLITLITTQLSLGLAFFYALTRWGLPTDWGLLGLALGLSWFVAWLPHNISLPVGWKSWCSLEMWQSGVVLGALASLCVMPGSVWFIAPIGWFWYGRSLPALFSLLRRQWWLIFFVGLLSLWLGSQVWGSQLLSPLFEEKIATGAAHPDTLFHLSITNMLRYYGVATTGVDGLVFVPYHFGSHFIFARLAEAASVRAVDWYNLFYPILFLPLLVWSVWLVAGIGRKTERSFAEWVWLSALFIGITPLPWKPWLGTTFFPAISESYTVGLVFGLLVTPWLIGWWQWRQKNNSLVVSLVWLLGLVGCVGLLGLIKISFLLAVAPMVGVWALWQKWWKLPEFWIAVIGLITVALSLKFTVTLPDHQPHVWLGYYAFELLGASGTATILIAGVALFATVWRSASKPLTLSLLASALTSFALANIWQTPGDTVQYIIDVHRWGLGITLLYFWPSKITNSKLLLIILSALLLLNTAWSTHSWYRDREFRFQELTRWFETINFQAATKNQDTAQLILQLKNLDTSAHDTTVMYDIPRTSMYWQLHPQCQAVPLIFPAAAGYPLSKGLPENCPLNAYGYSVFTSPH